MKTPKDYLAEMQMDDDILFNRHEVSVWLSDFIIEIQKDTYNQAIQDVERITPESWISIADVKRLKIK